MRDSYTKEKQVLEVTIVTDKPMIYNVRVLFMCQAYEKWLILLYQALGRVWWICKAQGCSVPRLERGCADNWNSCVQVSIPKHPNLSGVSNHGFLSRSTHFIAFILQVRKKEVRWLMNGRGWCEKKVCKAQRLCTECQTSPLRTTYITLTPISS